MKITIEAEAKEIAALMVELVPERLPLEKYEPYLGSEGKD